MEVAEYKSVSYASEDTEYDTTDRAFNSLLGADRGDKLMATKEAAAEISEGVSYPGSDKHEKVCDITKLHGTKLDYGDKACDDICAGRKRNAYLIDGKLAFRENGGCEKDKHYAENKGCVSCNIERMALYGLCQRGNNCCCNVKAEGNDEAFSHADASEHLVNAEKSHKTEKGRESYGV